MIISFIRGIFPPPTNYVKFQASSTKIQTIPKYQISNSKCLEHWILWFWYCLVLKNHHPPIESIVVYNIPMKSKKKKKEVKHG